MRKHAIGFLTGLFIAVSPAAARAASVQECSVVNDPGYVFLCNYPAGDSLLIFYEVSMSPKPCYGGGPGILSFFDRPQSGAQSLVGGGWEACKAGDSFISFEAWGVARTTVHNTPGEIYGRIHNNMGGGCCDAEDDDQGNISTANVNVTCRPAYTQPLSITIPVEKQVTKASISTTTEVFAYEAKNPMKIRVVTRLDYWSWYLTNVEKAILPLDVKPFIVYKLGPSGQYPDMIWIDEKNVEYDTTNDVLTVTQTYQLDPGKYLFRIYGDWFAGGPICNPPEGGLVPPAVLGSWKISEVPTPGLKLEDAPGNFPSSAPGQIVDPLNSFDVLHFRLTADWALAAPVVVESIAVALEASGDEMSQIQMAILHADPGCSGGAGATLAQDDTPTDGATFKPKNETIGPGQSKCYTVSLVPKTALASKACPCADFHAAVDNTDVSASANSAPVQVQGDLVTSDLTLGPQGLVANGPTSIESLPFKKTPISVSLNPGLCPTQWDAELTVITAPKGAKGYGFVNPADGVVIDGLYVAFPETGPAVVEVPFRAGDFAGLYQIQARAVSDVCSANVTLPPPVVFEVLAKPAPIVVNSTGPDGEPWVGDGVCSTGTMLDDDTPECTLLAAIMEANERPGADTIAFDLPPHVNREIFIEQWDQIPLQCPAVVDGTTQPGGGPVVLDGSKLSSGEDGLTLTGAGCTIKGLVVRKFPGSGIVSNADVNLRSVFSIENGGNGVRARGDIRVDGTGNSFRGNGGKASNPLEAHGLYTAEGHVFLFDAAVAENAGWGVVQGGVPALASGSELHDTDVSDNGKGGMDMAEPVSLSGGYLERNGGSAVVAPRVMAHGTGFYDNGGWGVEALGGGVQLVGTYFLNNLSGGALLMEGGAVAFSEGFSTIYSSIFEKNGADGVRYEAGPLLQIRESSFLDNKGYGVANGHPTEWVDARWNWWGAKDGPGGAGPGQGDEVTERVLTEFFAKEKFPVQVVPESEPVMVVPGVARDVHVTVLDAGQFSGSVTLSHEDKLGWIQGPKSVEVALSGGIGTAVLQVLAPQGAQGVNAVPLVAVPNGGDSKPGSGTLVLAVTDEADVAVGIVQEYTAVLPGGDIAWKVTVSNLGPGWASDVTLALSATGAQGDLDVGNADVTCQKTQTSTTCNFGGLSPGSSIELKVSAKAPAKEGEVTLVAEVFASSKDPNPANNTAQKATAVTTTTPAPDAKADPKSLAFGTVGLGGWTAPQLVRISNEGTAPLNVSAVTISGTDAKEFAMRDDGCKGKQVLPDDHCDVTIAFVPSQQGDLTATLSVASDDPDTPSVSLAGRGAVPPEVPALVSPAEGATVMAGDVEVQFIPGSGAPAGTKWTVVACEEETFEGCEGELVARGVPVGSPLTFLLAGVLLVPFVTRSGRRGLVSLLLVMATGFTLTCGGGGGPGTDQQGMDVPAAEIHQDAMSEAGPDGVEPGDPGQDTEGPEVRSHVLKGLKPGTKYYWKVVEKRPGGTTFESAVRTFVTGS